MGSKVRIELWQKRHGYSCGVKHITMRSKILRWLFGDPTKLAIVLVGDEIEEIGIHMPPK